MELKFKTEGGEVVLHGMANGAPRVITAKQMERAFRKGQITCAAHCLVSISTSSTDDRSYHVDIQSILDRHSTIFSDLPSGLPPDRGFQHIIEW